MKNKELNGAKALFMETNTEKDQSTNDLIAGESRSLDREKSLIEVIQEENMNSILQWQDQQACLRIQI